MWCWLDNLYIFLALGNKIERKWPKKNSLSANGNKNNDLFLIHPVRSRSQSVSVYFLSYFKMIKTQYSVGWFEQFFGCNWISIFVFPLQIFNSVFKSPAKKRKKWSSVLSCKSQERNENKCMCVFFHKKLFCFRLFLKSCHFFNRWKYKVENMQGTINNLNINAKLKVEQIPLSNINMTRNNNLMLVGFFCFVSKKS